MNAPTLLVPLDGSRFGEWALAPALGLARALKGTIQLVSVYEDKPLVAGWPLDAGEVEAWFEQYLADVTRRLADVSDVPVSEVLLAGRVGDRLEEHVGQTQPSLVVMCTHGRGAFSRFWLGSVADRMVRHLTVPVLLVRPRDDEEIQLTDTLTFERVLVPLDGSARAEGSLEVASQITRAAQGTCILLRVVPPPLPTTPYLPHAIAETDRAAESGRRESQQYLRDMEARLERDGLRVETEVVTGVHAAPGIVRACESTGADLIVIATHGRGGLPRLLLGSVADKVVRAAPVPVLVTRPRAERPPG